MHDLKTEKSVHGLQMSKGQRESLLKTEQKIKNRLKKSKGQDVLSTEDRSNVCSKLRTGQNVRTNRENVTTGKRVPRS